MADDRGFFDEHDPEQAIARLAAHAAEAERDRRSTPWLVLGGATVTTGLVVAAFVLGLTGGPAVTEVAGPEAPTVTATVTTHAVGVLVAPRATLAPKPEPERTPRSPTPTPVPETVVVQAAAVAKPPQEHPEEQPKQVGPNRPIDRPIDPDDR